MLSSEKRKEILEILKVEVEISASKSGGAGGQNVNKTNSKANLRWDIENSNALNSAQKKRFIERFSHHINEEGFYIHAHQEERSLYLNIQNGYDKILSFMNAIWSPPKKRIATKPTRASIKERLDKKRSRSNTKENRKKIKI